MKIREIRSLSFLCSLCLTIVLVASLNITSMASPVALFSSDFEEEDAKSIIRSENANGRVQITEEVPGGRDGHCMKANLAKSFFGLQPKGIGTTLYSYGTFQEGDTFHLRVDVYPDKEGDLSIYPFILCCINGYNPKTKEEKLANYKEWYPKENLGTLTINEGGSTIKGQEWTTLDYTFTVKDGCADGGRDVDFWTDAGAFYIYFESSMAGLDVYVDNVIIDMDTNIEPTKTLPNATTTTKTTETTQPELLLGDANDDGVLDMKDVLFIRKKMAHMTVTINEKNADYNGDGNLDMKDVLSIRRFLAHMS